MLHYSVHEEVAEWADANMHRAEAIIEDAIRQGGWKTNITKSQLYGLQNSLELGTSYFHKHINDGMLKSEKRNRQDLVTLFQSLVNASEWIAADAKTMASRLKGRRYAKDEIIGLLWKKFFQHVLAHALYLDRTRSQ